MPNQPSYGAKQSTTQVWYVALSSEARRPLCRTELSYRAKQFTTQVKSVVVGSEASRPYAEPNLLIGPLNTSAP